MRAKGAKRMKRKGQMLVFEQVLLFTIGVIILMTSFTLFAMYQSFYLSSTSQDHLTEVKEYVLSSIIMLSENSEANSSIVLSIPKTIGNKFYRLRLSPEGLNVTQEPEGHLEAFSRLHGLNTTFAFSGRVDSDLGKVVLYKYGNSIVLDAK